MGPQQLVEQIVLTQPPEMQPPFTLQMLTTMEAGDQFLTEPLNAAWCHLPQWYRVLEKAVHKFYRSTVTTEDGLDAYELELPVRGGDDVADDVADDELEALRLSPIDPRTWRLSEVTIRVRVRGER